MLSNYSGNEVSINTANNYNVTLVVLANRVTSKKQRHLLHNNSEKVTANTYINFVTPACR